METKFFKSISQTFFCPIPGLIYRPIFHAKIHREIEHFEFVKMKIVKNEDFIDHATVHRRQCKTRREYQSNCTLHKYQIHSN